MIFKRLIERIENSKSMHKQLKLCCRVVWYSLKILDCVVIGLLRCVQGLSMTPKNILNLSRISLFEKLNIGKASGKVFIMTFENICNIIPMYTVLQIINIIANS